MTRLPLIEHALAHGQRVAMRSGSQLWTYAELVQASAEVASLLLGGKADLCEARVAFLIPASHEYVIAQWAIWRAGAVSVPLSLSATEAELEYVLTDSQATIVLVTDGFPSKLAELCECRRIRLLSVRDISKEANGSLPEVQLGRRAMILYTSGTTNKPKGVVTTHACIQAQVESLVQAWHWQADDRIPLFLPLHHIHGIVNVLLCALWSGAEVESFSRFDSETILRRVAENAWSVFMAVPTIYVKLIAALEAVTAEERARIVAGFAQQRLMVSGSAALPASVHRKWTELTGQKLLERYGMTEIGMALSNPYNGERRPGAVGQPLPNVEVRLQSEQGDIIREEQTAGEIHVRGPTVFLEYWNRPLETAQAFQDGWFATGDIAVLESGYFRILGRSSIDIIKSGGYKLSALEIEASLLDHPSIAQCAVVGLPDDTWGEIVAAALVLTGDHTLDLAALRSWCAKQMSHYKIPRQFHTVDQLPRNAMGKVTKLDVVKLFGQKLSSQK
jgi:malonyl-CoA/methylmalonyl-CoA synthetase